VSLLLGRARAGRALTPSQRRQKHTLEARGLKGRELSWCSPLRELLHLEWETTRWTAHEGRGGETGRACCCWLTHSLTRTVGMRERHTYTRPHI